MAKEATAALFMNGGSQAVRLPRDFRFEGNAVRIWREGKRVILEPLEKAAWPDGFWEGVAERPLASDFEIGPALPDDAQERERSLRELADE